MPYRLLSISVAQSCACPRCVRMKGYALALFGVPGFPAPICVYWLGLN